MDPHAGEPLIPRPALTPDALRTAVERLTPSRMQAFVRDLGDATTSAQQLQSLAPLRTFVHTWGVFVAIQRYPSRAARLRHLEEVVSGGSAASRRHHEQRCSDHVRLTCRIEAVTLV
jgi:hypothetical protein